LHCVRDNSLQAWQLWKEGLWLQLVDTSLVSDVHALEIVRCINIALLCVQELAADRPTMSHVVSMLSSESTTLPEPKHPAYSHIKGWQPKKCPQFLIRLVLMVWQYLTKMVDSFFSGLQAIWNIYIVVDWKYFSCFNSTVCLKAYIRRLLYVFLFEQLANQPAPTRATNL
jgi:hypothetical protein